VSRALVTGGAGFIGAHLAARLVREGLDVDLVDDFSRARRDDDLAALHDSGRVGVLQRDLRAPRALDDLGERYDHIFHLAAIVGVGRVVRQPLAVLTDSVAMLRNVVSCAARQPRLTRMVFLSTSEVYAGTLASFGLPFPTPESTPLTVSPLHEPRSAYMLSKIYGEAICRHAGVPFTILRPHNVYGPRMGLSHVIPEVLQRAHDAPDGGRLEVASVEHRRTFCYVDDAVEIIWRAASASACAGETLNLGADRPEVAIGQLGRLIAATVGKRLEIVPLPVTAGSPPRRCPDVSRTRELTGYEPVVDLESGLARTYDWYRRNVFTSSGRAA
jgi:UDP-glucose 4-epimerase